MVPGCDGVELKRGGTMSEEQIKIDNAGVSTSPVPSVAPAKRAYERSTIEFPYYDLNEVVAVVRAIHDNAGVSCTLDQLAGYMKQPITSGGFRGRVANAGTFRLTENERYEVRLSELGRAIMDQEQEGNARVEAFLAVPLYNSIFDKYRGFTMPPPSALEREMVSLGVAPKQTDKARQAFMRSAEQAGFFAHGQDRLVRPSFSSAPSTRPLETPTDTKQNGSGFSKGGGRGGGDDLPPRHPLIEGMFQSLPANGQPWTLDEVADWLHAAAYNLRFAYKLKGKITVDIKIERPEGTG
jgi:hypothetical protein